MTTKEPMPAVLVLANGSVYHGKAAGKIGTTTGEICFNTGMTGYQEIFTDPSYFGQVMVTTNAHIGNYGIKRQKKSRAMFRLEVWYVKISPTNIRVRSPMKTFKNILKTKTLSVSTVSIRVKS